MLMKMLSAVYSIEVLLMFSVQFYCESLLAVGYIFICLSLKDVQCFSLFVCFFHLKQNVYCYLLAFTSRYCQHI